MEEINLDTFKADTTGWSEYCMGYNTLKLPPDMVAFLSAATHVDFHYPEITRNYLGTALDKIKSHGRYGNIVSAVNINGWDFVVAWEKFDYGISDEALIFFGAKKVGRDVILLTEDASTDIVGEGSDPKYREFYELLEVEPITPKNRSKGFCYDGYVFLGYMPKLSYNFSADFGTPPGSVERHSYSVTLSQKMKRPPKDSRPLAPQDDGVEEELKQYFDIDEKLLKKFGNVGVLTHMAGTKDDVIGKHFLKALTESSYGDLKHPDISVETVEEITPMSYSDGLEEFLSFLGAIQPN